MKHIFFTVFLLCYIGISAQKSTISLTFTARNSGQYVQLNNVLIENLTQGGDTMLYAPDTVLILDYIVSISDNRTSTGTMFTLSQNYPNPIVSKTRIDLILSETKNTLITVTNFLGQEVLNQELLLDRGSHTFIFIPGSSRLYFLTVQIEQQYRTIKMLNSPFCYESSNTCEMIYAGQQTVHNVNKSINQTGNFIFNPGDLLKFTAYSSLGYRIIEDSPSGNHTYTFQYSSGTPCPGIPTISDIDGNVYTTVLIGTQCWMKENLRTTKYRDGSPIPNVSEDSAWLYLNTGAYVWYDNDSSWKNKYGAIYNWYSVDNLNGLCPTAWHVPSADEWVALTNSIGGIYNADELKSCRQVNSPLGGYCNVSEHPRWYQDSTYHGTDYSGFSGLPGGFRYEFGSFGNIGRIGYWWSSTEAWTTTARSRSMSYMTGFLGGCNCIKERGFSIRCLKD